MDRWSAGSTTRSKGATSIRCVATLVMIGFSERSSPAAIDHLASLLFEHTPIEDVIIVVMPKENTAIHLDMIFTQVDRELCVVYPPHFVGPERLAVLHWRKGQAQMREMPNVFAALQAVGLPLEPIFCGGERRVMQEREQWSSGCNFCAMRPGVVTSYASQRSNASRNGEDGIPSHPGGGFSDWRRPIARQRSRGDHVRRW